MMINYLDSQTMLGFLLVFLAFQIVQALFINGVKIAATGETEILPDGTEKDSEMILYPIYKFLCKKYKTTVYYENSQLNSLLLKLETYLGANFNFADFPMETIEIQLQKVDPEIMITRNGEGYLFYKYVEHYFYSKYIRKPIIQCIICMASFWGFFTYWVPAYFVFGITEFSILLWLINTICLSYSNYLIFKKL